MDKDLSEAGFLRWNVIPACHVIAALKCHSGVETYCFLSGTKVTLKQVIEMNAKSIYLSRTERIVRIYIISKLVNISIIFKISKNSLYWLYTAAGYVTEVTWSLYTIKNGRQRMFSLVQFHGVRKFLDVLSLLNSDSHWVNFENMDAFSRVFSWLPLRET